MGRALLPRRRFLAAETPARPASAADRVPVAPAATEGRAMEQRQPGRKPATPGATELDTGARGRRPPMPAVRRATVVAMGAAFAVPAGEARLAVAVAPAGAGCGETPPRRAGERAGLLGRPSRPAVATAGPKARMAGAAPRVAGSRRKKAGRQLNRTEVAVTGVVARLAPVERRRRRALVHACGRVAMEQAAPRPTSRPAALGRSG